MKQKVIFIATIYETYPIIVPSLLCMTHKNWELYLVHDGPAHKFNYQEFFSYYKDQRIHYIETPTRKQNFGHPNKQWLIEEINQGRVGKKSDFLVITNSDNYYVPGFCEIMLRGFEHDNILATYCAEMPHSYVGWSVMNSCLQQGRIDIGQLMFRAAPAVELGWPNDYQHSADWIFIDKFINKHGRWAVKQVNGALFVHN